MALKTIKVKRKDNNAEFVVINESDFNKDIDTIYEAKESKAPAKKSDKKSK